MSELNPYTDVVELCAILQCLGFTVKTLNTTDSNSSQRGSARTIEVNCRASGFHVVLENESHTCSCPLISQQQNSGFWQVSGISGGKQLEKKSGSVLLGSLPKAHHDRLTKDLLEIVRCVKEKNESDLDKSKDRESLCNKSSSLNELNTPEKCLFQVPSDTPTRYRSLDTLTTAKEPSDPNLPAPGPLQKHVTNVKPDIVNEQDNTKFKCQRQSTYTLSTTPDNIILPNKTSSPIYGPENHVLEQLISAEKTAEDLRNKLAVIIREINENGKNDSSLNSLVFDVSKISVLKGAETSKAQFASSPNLSALSGGTDEFPKSRLKRGDSSSTSSLASNKLTVKDGKVSRLRRISPNILKCKKDASGSSKIEKSTSKEKASIFNLLSKTKTTTKVCVPKVDLEQSPNLSASRKKYSHVKSTIPRPATKK